MELKYEKIYAPGTDVGLKVTKGHFATNHAHTNYYIDLTTIKSRVSEAQEIARALVHMYLYDMVVDTIVCMEGTEVIGTLLAEELTKGGFLSLNAHKTIYIIKPEFNSNSQIMFKDNFRPMLNGKNVILLTATVTTGLTINKAHRGNPVLRRHHPERIGSVQRPGRDERDPRSNPYSESGSCRIICSAITATVRSARKERSWMR